MPRNRLPISTARHEIVNIQNIATSSYDCDNCLLTDLCIRGGNGGSCYKVEKENIDTDQKTPNLLLGNLFGSPDTSRK